MARRLDPTHIIATIERLRQRIDERFPGSGLGRLAGDLLALAREAAAVSDRLQRPMWSIRAGALIVVVLAGALMVAAARSLPAPLRFDSLLDVLQAIEAGINDAIFLAVALFFLGTLEQRVKRRRALVIIHRLRSVAHIVDMHQLTKDPDRLRAGRSTTASSPRAPLSVEALGRYLDYCSELLSLTSKVAALFGEHRSDPVVLSAINEVELLATGLSTKVWQKITILNATPNQALPTSPASSPKAPLTGRSSAKR